ncbi:hypothetical protein [Pseudomonas cyclaminis]|nr:hypothetical protein [Pseudomonas cyclaminis]MBE8603283.1 hypothetical protein [Pseudomonas cyclaminis]
MIVDELRNRCLEGRISLTLCESADQARLELKSEFDLMILDVVLPKKLGGTPQALNSFNLLRDMYHPSNKYLKPSFIIGLTADIKDIGDYRLEFGERFITVTEGSMSSIDWLNKIFDAVIALLGAEQKKISNKTDKILITVHGIRTYGQWQKDLKDSVRSFSRDFDYFDMKYGFFDLISFAIPKLRDRRAEKTSKRILAILEKNQEKNIYIVAHSYGTYITSKALESYTGEQQIKKIIFCGSPLPHDHNIDHVVEKSEATVNECGTSDIVLIIARMLLPGMGDAGRVGFSREGSNNFMNRYHIGGHSLYFDSNKKPTFYDTYWTPILTTDADAEYSDKRKNYIGEDIVDLAIKLISKSKAIIYLTLITSTGYYLVQKII